MATLNDQKKQHAIKPIINKMPITNPILCSLSGNKKMKENKNKVIRNDLGLNLLII